MTVETNVTAKQMGRVLAEAARDELRIAEVWIMTRPDAVYLWLISTPITLAEHRSLTRLEDLLYERFPGVAFDFHIVNPRNYTKDVHQVLPPDAERIAL